MGASQGRVVALSYSSRSGVRQVKDERKVDWAGRGLELALELAEPVGLQLGVQRPRSCFVCS